MVQIHPYLKQKITCKWSAYSLGVVNENLGDYSGIISHVLLTQIKNLLD